MNRSSHKRTNLLIRLITTTLLGLVASMSTACARVISWDEEVPLNTGETIWVQREVEYQPVGASGNPADIALRARKRVIRFKYRDVQYSFEEDAAVFLLAISPSRVPVLIAPTASYGWDRRNTYYCVTPQYVQFQPDSSGTRWTWPDRIEPWLMQLEANILQSIPTPESPLGGATRVTAQERNLRDANHRFQFPAGAKVLPNFKSSCISRN